MATQDIFRQHSDAGLVNYYNDVAPQLGKKPIKGFTSREAAERECEAIRAEIRIIREEMENSQMATATKTTTTKPAKAPAAPKAPKAEAAPKAPKAEAAPKAPKAEKAPRTPRAKVTPKVIKPHAELFRPTSIRGMVYATLAKKQGKEVKMDDLAAVASTSATNIDGAVAVMNDQLRNHDTGMKVHRTGGKNGVTFRFDAADATGTLV